MLIAGPTASGKSALALELAQKTGQAPEWNFHKYLIARNGAVVTSYTSLTAPDSATLVKDIEKQLAAH